MKEKMKKGKSKRSQVTIFVIIAVIIVAALVAMFILMGKQKITALSPVENPKGYIEDCIKTSSQEALVNIIPSGGLLNAQNYFKFNGMNVLLLCSTGEYERLCTNQHPMLSREIENQIIISIRPAVEKCFAKVSSSLAGYDYRENSQLQLSAEITPGLLSVKASKKIAYSKNEQAITLENFGIRLNSALWDFVSISNEIVNEEINCNCPSDNCGPLVEKLSNSKYEVGHFVAGSGSEVYSIKEIDTGDIFNIAVKNCVKEPL